MKRRRLLTLKGDDFVHILFFVRRHLMDRPAGDTVQILKTAQYLRDRGISVTIDSAATAANRFDLIHFWGLSPMETLYPAFFRAARAGRQIVLSPIYWDLSRYYESTGSIQRLNLWNEQRPLRREITAGSARIFVSGENEAQALAEDVGMPLSCTVVPCGIDAQLLGGKLDCAQTRTGILCAARIGPRKNQIALAQQCALCRIPLILAGPVGNQAYFNQCLQYPNVQYAGVASPQRLATLYRRCLLHALVGYAETPGLASLEAAACGCEIVTTSEGTAEEYFGGEATYCDPYARDDIGAAIHDALGKKRQPRLRDSILEHFSWEACLRPLLDAYSELG